MIQTVSLVLSLGLMALVAFAFIKVAASAGGKAMEYPPIQQKSNRGRTLVFGLIVVAGIVITLATTTDLPYRATHGGGGPVDKVVEVEAYQWYWQLSTDYAQENETVVFNVTSGDVNHGLGVYDEDMKLVGQTQAMPGYTNSLELSFDKPGTYRLMCMEYCGEAHHAMTSQFSVVSKQGE